MPSATSKLRRPIGCLHEVCTNGPMERKASKPQRCITLAVAAVLISFCVVAFGQTQEPGLTSLPSAEQVIQRNQDPFAGSLPTGQVTPGVIDLTVQDALDR